MRRDIFISIVLFFLTIFIVGKNLDKPFFGIHDWNGARYGNIARNYVRYGVFTLKFAQIENSGVVAAKDYQYFTHYPPLLPLLISLSYRIFGINEWATRLVAILATAGTITLIYLIGRTIFDWKIGISASLLALATPMVRYFGKNPVHEPLALLFALISFFGVALLFKKKKNSWLLIYLGLILALLTTWSGAFLTLSISVILFRKVAIRKIIALWLIAAFLVGLHFLHIFLLTGSLTGGDIFRAFLERTALGGGNSLTHFGILEFINRIRIWTFTLFTVSLSFMAFLGGYFLFKEGKEIQKKFLLGIFIYGVSYPLIFPNATFIHNYFIFRLIPTFAFLSSFAISRIFKNKFFILFPVLLVFVWFEKNEFVKALENSRTDELAVRIGKKIKEKVDSRDTVTFKPYSFGASRLPYLAFYSDRKITLDPKSSYNWTVEVDEKNGSYQILRRER